MRWHGILLLSFFSRKKPPKKPGRPAVQTGDFTAKVGHWWGWAFLTTRTWGSRSHCVSGLGYRQSTRSTEPRLNLLPSRPRAVWRRSGSSAGPWPSGHQLRSSVDSRERSKCGEHKPSGRTSVEKSTHPTLSSQSFPVSKARQKLPRESAGKAQGLTQGKLGEHK